MDTILEYPNFRVFFDVSGSGVIILQLELAKEPYAIAGIFKIQHFEILGHPTHYGRGCRISTLIMVPINFLRNFDLFEEKKEHFPAQKLTKKISQFFLRYKT